MRRRLAALAAAIVLAGMLAGCSQVAAIAPVGGNRVSDVRYAANDILVSEDVPVLTAPVCEVDEDGLGVACEGTTLDGTAITVVSTASDSARVTVKVGDDVLYDGSIQDVLDAAMRPAS